MVRRVCSVRAEEREKRDPYNIGFECNRLGLEPGGTISERNHSVQENSLAEIRFKRPEHCPELVFLARLRLEAFELIRRYVLWQRRNVGGAGW